MACEIYLCKKGQKLKEGRMVMSDIASKDEAMSDAEDRCRRDNTIAKIGYYLLNDMGDFRLIYSHTNPHATGDDPVAGGTTKKKKKRRKKKPEPKGVIEKFKHWLNT